MVIAMMFKPRQDYILVRPIDRKVSDVIEVVNAEKHCRGEILAVGPGKRNKKGRLIPLDAQVGQVVAFGDGNFDFYPKFYEGNECFRIIQEADITHIEENENAT